MPGPLIYSSKYKKLGNKAFTDFGTEKRVSILKAHYKQQYCKQHCPPNTKLAAVTD